MEPVYWLLLVAVFVCGLLGGKLWGMSGKEVEEPQTPYQKVKIVKPKLNFLDQLDPVMPEGTRRGPIKEKEVDDE